MKGLFITFEGGEGSGKSTQSRLLADHLKSLKMDVLLTREPGGSEGGEVIRQLLVSGDVNRWSALSETFLIYAARANHFERLIAPALEKGMVVICDRFADSTIAYQSYARGEKGVSVDFLKVLYEKTLGTFKPNRTYILDIDPTLGLERTIARTGDEVRFESMSLGFHERLRKGFLDIAHAERDRCYVISSEQSPDSIHAAILQDLKEKGFLTS